MKFNRLWKREFPVPLVDLGTVEAAAQAMHSDSPLHRKDISNRLHGDILATLSPNDGDTWEEPVMIFDHHQHQGMVQSIHILLA